MKDFTVDTILLEFKLEAGVSRVFSAITAEIGGWWTHRFRENGRVHFENFPGGRFYEKWGSDGDLSEYREQGALYAVVTYFEPPRKLRLSGPMGMQGAVVSSMQFELQETDGGTLLTLTHEIAGTVPAETVEDYRKGWQELLGTALREFLVSSR